METINNVYRLKRPCRDNAGKLRQSTWIPAIYKREVVGFLCGNPIIRMFPWAFPRSLGHWSKLKETVRTNNLHYLGLKCKQENWIYWYLPYICVVFLFSFSVSISAQFFLPAWLELTFKLKHCLLYASINWFPFVDYIHIDTPSLSDALTWRSTQTLYGVAGVRSLLALGSASGSGQGRRFGSAGSCSFSPSGGPDGATWAPSLTTSCPLQAELQSGSLHLYQQIPVPPTDARTHTHTHTHTHIQLQCLWAHTETDDRRKHSTKQHSVYLYTYLLLVIYIYIYVYNTTKLTFTPAKLHFGWITVFFICDNCGFFFFKCFCIELMLRP